MVRLDWRPTVRTGVSHRLIGKMQTLKKALLVYVLATTREAGLGVREVNPDRRNS